MKGGRDMDFTNPKYYENRELSWINLTGAYLRKQKTKIFRYWSA